MSDGVDIGIGNRFRRDDGVGLTVADEIAKRGLADVRVMTAIGEPGAILDAWTGARLAIVVDAAMGENAKPDRASLVSHAFGLPADLCAGRSSRTATRETRRFGRGHRRCQSRSWVHTARGRRRPRGH